MNDKLRDLEIKINNFNQLLEKNINLNCIVENLSGETIKDIHKFNKNQKNGNLFGKTIAVKNNINIEGTRTDCCSRILNNYVSPYDATVIERVKNSGGAIVGKTNMDEFAMGSSTEYSSYGPTINNHGKNRVAGGSSGGSAVSVSSGIVDLALGSDTGGSVRQPASFCGIYGLKPTYGRVSRYGLTAFASSFDQVGIFSKNIDDMQKLFFSISGYDSKDSTTSKIEKEPFNYNLSKIQKMKIGLPYNFDNDTNISREVLKYYNDIISFLLKKGFDIINLNIDSLKYAVSSYYVLTTAEASSNLARFDGIRYGESVRKGDLESIYVNTRTKGFGEEVKRRIIIGTYVLSSGYYDKFYSKAQKVRKIIKDDFENAFKKVDLMFLPTCPDLPYKLGDKKGDPLSVYLSDIFTVPMNLSGVPAISLPVGFSKNKLPIGMQFVANNFQENNLFSICKFLEDENKIIN